MSIGKKIGGGFLLIVLLNMVVALVAYNAMDGAKQTSNTIATLQVPSLTTYSSGQVAMLQTTRNLEIFLSTSSEQAIRDAQKSLNEIKGDVIGKLTGYQQKKPTAAGGKFLDTLKKDIATFEASAKKVIQYKKDINEASKTFNAACNTVLGKLRGLVVTMSHTQREFMDQGNMTNARQYAQNMADTTVILSRVATTRAQLLSAERNNDLALFAKTRDELPNIKNDCMKIRSNLAREECRTLFDDAVKAYEEFSKEADQLTTLQMESAKLKEQLEGISAALLGQTDQMADQVAGETVKAVETAESELGSASTFMVTLIIGSLIISIILAVVITRMVVNPLAETQVFAQAVAGGDLERQFTFHSNDELGLLADDLREMVESLKNNMAMAHQKSAEAEKATEEAKKAMADADEARHQAECAKRDGMLQAANNLSEVVDAVSIVSKSLNEGIATSDRGAKDQAHIVAETSNSMEEMKAAVNGVAQSASHASTVATDVRSKAQEGVNQVAQVTESMAELSSASAEISKDMAQLGKQANDIGAILSVISDIADQTNLLALNAAIEAARAGEAGRGFAVVADEVRKLAEKTMSATQEVNQAISSIQQSVRTNIDNVGRTGEMAEHVTEIVQQSGMVLDEILHLAEASADQVRSIAAASEEQSASCEHIGQSVDHISSIASQVVDTMQEADSAMQELLAQSNRLSHLIEEMKKG